MFVPTSPQRGLFETDALLSEKGRALLKRSWAETFAREVLPQLLALESQLEPLYSTTGRPNWSAARMLGLLLLRELLGIGSDRELVESLAFDARFQHALGLTPEDSYLSRRSLVDFRRRFESNGEVLARQVFDDVTAAAISALRVSTGTQRVDSTFVQSNIAIRGRTALLAESLERLLDALGAERRGRVEADTRAWYGDQGSWDSRAGFELIARWLHRVLREFRNDDEVTPLESYQLALTLLNQHVRMVPLNNDSGDDDDNEPPPAPAKASSSKKRKSTSRKKKNRAQRAARRKGRAKAKLDLEQSDDDCAIEADKSRHGNRIQSIHDQDARLGYKGTGYLIQVTETCGNVDVELITDIAVAPGNTSDITALPGVLESLGATGRIPTRLLSDAGYLSIDNLMLCADNDVDLFGPMRRLPRAEKALDRADFSFDTNGDALACPEGHAPTRHQMIATGSHPDPQPHALFSKEKCHECPRRSECPVVDRKHETRLRIDAGIRARDTRHRVQKTSEFKRVYTLRSGIEATNSELKRAHAFGRFTVRGTAKIKVRALLKAAGCNIKRWHRAAIMEAA